MRYVIICLLCGIVVMTMAASVLAQNADPCEGIRCHDNSKCAVRDSKLVCVCDKGYQAEADGSGCKPKPPETDANSFIVPGSILTVVGGAMTIIGGVLMRVGQDEYDEECKKVECRMGSWPGAEKQVPGIGLFVVGLPTLIIGVILLSVGLVKRKRMERNKLAFDIRTKRGKITLEPTFAAGENGGVFGLSGRF